MGGVKFTKLNVGKLRARPSLITPTHVGFLELQKKEYPQPTNMSQKRERFFYFRHLSFHNLYLRCLKSFFPPHNKATAFDHTIIKNMKLTLEDCTLQRVYKLYGAFSCMIFFYSPRKHERNRLSLTAAQLHCAEGCANGGEDQNEVTRTTHTNVVMM